MSGVLNNMGLEMLMNMFGGLGAGGMTVPSRSDGYCSHSHSLVFINRLFLFWTFYWFFQYHRNNCMLLNCHSFKKWVSLTRRRTYRHWPPLRGTCMLQWTGYWGTPVSEICEPVVCWDLRHIEIPFWVWISTNWGSKRHGLVDDANRALW